MKVHCCRNHVCDRKILFGRSSTQHESNKPKNLHYYFIFVKLLRSISGNSIFSWKIHKGSSEYTGRLLFHPPTKGSSSASKLKKRYRKWRDTEESVGSTLPRTKYHIHGEIKNSSVARVKSQLCYVSWIDVSMNLPVARI